METSRLILRKVVLSDSEFIYELVNTPDWIKFIGDRNVKSVGDASKFIQKIRENPAMIYWVACLKNESFPVGIVSFVKRDYLDHYDLGFALLPKYEKLGLAYEASKEILQIELQKKLHKKILAITVSSNEKSIRLLLKLKFRFQENRFRGEENLLIYST